MGISISVFNQASKIAIFPLVSVTTSFVAEEDAIQTLSTEAPKYEELEKGISVDKELEMDDLTPLLGIFPYTNRMD